MPMILYLSSKNAKPARNYDFIGKIMEFKEKWKLEVNKEKSEAIEILGKWESIRMQQDIK